MLRTSLKFFALASVLVAVAQPAAAELSILSILNKQAEKAPELDRSTYLRWDGDTGRKAHVHVLALVQSITKPSKGLFGFGGSAPSSVQDTAEVVFNVLSGPQYLQKRFVTIQLPLEKANDLSVKEYAGLGLTADFTTSVCVQALSADELVQARLGQWICK